MQGTDLCNVWLDLKIWVYPTAIQPQVGEFHSYLERSWLFQWRVAPDVVSQRK